MSNKWRTCLRSRWRLHSPVRMKAIVIAIGSKLGIDATKKLRGAGFVRPWPPLIKMDSAVKANAETLLTRGSRREEARLEKG